MTTVLLTGFEPFAGDGRNPSGEAVERVGTTWEGPERLITAVLPVGFRSAASALDALIAEHDPDVVIAAGLAGGRAAVSVERVAVNLMDARIADNDGVRPTDQPSVSGGAAGLFSSLPVKAIARAVSDAGIPAEVSLSAGTFVCNHVFYRAAHWAAHAGRRAGFVHVPWAAEHGMPDAPALPLEDIARALAIAVRTTLDTPEDIAAPGGALH